MYQLSEFFMCIGVRPDIVIHISFVVITFLPPTGLYLVTKMTNQQRPELVLYFLVGTLFSIYYGLKSGTVELIDCNPLYAIYSYQNSSLYGIYYYFTILLSIYLLVYYLLKKHELKQANKNPLLLLMGYLAFLLPMGIITIIDPSLNAAIPSIMCKYALSLAIMLTLIVYSSDNVIE